MKANFGLKTKMKANFGLKTTAKANFGLTTKMRASFGPGFVSAVPVATILSITDAPDVVTHSDIFAVEVTVLDQFSNGLTGITVELSCTEFTETEDTGAGGVATFTGLQITTGGAYVLTASHALLSDTHTLTVFEVYDIGLHKGVLYKYGINTADGIRLNKGQIYPSIRRM